MAIAMTGATLAAGLLVALPSASLATQRHPALRLAATSRVPESLTGAARADLIAAETRPRVRGISTTAAGFTSATLLNTRAHTGIIAGVVRSMAGMPFAGACITATGPSGSPRAVSRSDGRYMLTGLRPGRYELTANVCARSRDAGSRVAILWARQSPMVLVQAGQVARLMPATVEGASLFRPGARPAAAPGSTGTGSISGLVTGHGRPLRGICVEADPVNGGQGGFATTSRTGRYRLTHLPPASYQVNFAGFDCDATSNWLSQWYPGITSLFPPGNAKAITVRAGKNVPGIDGRLKLGSAIAGTVRSRSGKRLGGICVNINGAIRGGFIGVGGLRTGKRGSFVLHGLFPGRYQAEFMIGCGSRGNYAFQWWRGATSHDRATTIRVVGHKVVRNIDPVLAPGAAITGTVRGRNASGPPLSDVCVSAFGARDGNDDADAFTSRNGRYELEGLAAGRYQIQFDPSCGGGQAANYLGQFRSVGVRAGKTVSGFNAYLRPGAAVSGKVTDVHGHPIESICVLVGDGSETETNPDGTYSILGIQPGAWTVQFAGGCGNDGSYAPQFYDNQPDDQLATAVTFKAARTTRNIDAVMQPGGTIAGVVTNHAGHRLSNICVGAATDAQTELGEVFTSITFTDNGRYLMQNLTPNPYLIQFGCAGGRYASQWFRSQPDSARADLVSVNPGVTTMASARLSLAGSIAGVVTNQAGHPLSGICVSLVDPRNKNFVTLPGAPGSTAKTGRYVLGSLPAGRYLVQFMDCHLRARYGSQWYRGKTTVSAATPVTVRAGRRTTGISARLGIGGSISGVVTGPSGRPLRGVCVEAFDAQSEAFGLATTTRAGTYTVTGLSSGRYQIFFFGCSPGTQNLAGESRPGLVRVIAPHKVTGIDARLTPGGSTSSGSMSGTVTSAAPPGSPRSETCVLVVPASRGGSFDSAFTGPRGGYVVRNLVPGTYLAYFGDPFCQFFGEGLLFLAPQWFSGQPTQARATHITVTAGHTTRKIDAALRPYGSVTGTVTDHARAGVRGECVTAVPFNDPPDPFTGLPDAPEIAISARNGHYMLADLAPGRYKVQFSTGCGDSGFATQWWRAAASSKTAMVITVGFATIGGIDAVLRR